MCPHLRRAIAGPVAALWLLVASPDTPASAQERPAAGVAHDPSGRVTGAARDVPVRNAAAPTLGEVMETVGHNRIAINVMWTLLCGCLVMFMQAGFALVETGFTRARNVAHTMAMNLMVFAVGMVGYWACGFAFQMGGVGALASLGGGPILTSEVTVELFGREFGLIGMKGFFLGGEAYDVSVFALFLFQMALMATAATIPTGSMAERWKFPAFLVFVLFMSAVVYPSYANWVWGGGWLAQLGTNFGLGHGHVDFAGSSVVHMVGGIAALAGAIVVGPRIGKFTTQGQPVPIPGHHVPMALAGTFVLAFGWFGFTAGSTLSGGDLRIAVIAVNTMLAGAAGALTAMWYVWMRFGRPDPTMIANGLLAGLVSIAGAGAFVNSVAAFVIGAAAGVLVVAAVLFVEGTLKVDDPVGAVSVHAVSGTWGALAVGLFADGSYGHGLNGVPGGVRGLLYGDASQLAAATVAVLTCWVFVFVVFGAFFMVVELLIGNRASPDAELEGLDMPEMGAMGYPEFVLAPGPEAGSAMALPPRGGLGRTAYRRARGN